MKNWITALIVLLMSLSANAQELFEKGMKAYEDKEYHLAIGLFTQVIDADEESESISAAYNFRGEAYHNLQDYKNAYEDYNKAIELNPEYALAYQNRGTLYQSYWFKYDKAITDYDKAIEINPQFELAYFNRASLKWNMKDLEGALADYNKMLTDFNPDDTEVIGYVRRIKSEMGIVDDSIEEEPVVYTPPPTEDPIEEEPVVYTPPPTEDPIEEEPVVKNPPINDSTEEEPVVYTPPSTEDPIEEEPVVKNPPINDSTEEEPVVYTPPSTEDPIEEEPVVKNPPINDSTEEEPVADNNSNLKVFWMNPDPFDLPDGKLYVENDQLTIKLKASSQHALLANNFTVSINGLPANYKAEAATIMSIEDVFIYSNTIKLQPEANTIKVRVSNSTGSTYSKELEVVFSQRKPDLHVLSIGPKTVNLKYTQKDAEDFADIFKDQEGEGSDKIFANVFAKKLTGKKATTNEIRGVIEEYLYQQDVKPTDMLLLFVSSHGFMEGNDFRIHGSDYNPLRRLSTSVSFKDDITTHLTALNCKKIVFIDACHSGGARGDVLNIYEAIKKVSQKQNISLTFTSSSQNQLSYEDESWDNGAFTKALIDGMKNGKADANADKIITVEELSNYVTTSVRTMVRELKNELQEPSFINDDNKGVERSLPLYVVEE